MRLTPARSRAPGFAARLTAAALLAGCGAAAPQPSHRSRVTTGSATATIPRALLAGARPIGRGPRFTPPVKGHPVGVCAAPLGRRDRAHIELFARDRVVLLATGIGVQAPTSVSDGRLTRAACFGAVVTLDPTGTVYFRPGAGVTLAEVFAAWGQRLSPGRIASFTGGAVRLYVDGRRRRVPARSLKLTDGAEIVLEIGPYVPPHRAFTFPISPPPGLH